jgi:hypothetical protein
MKRWPPFSGLCPFKLFPVLVDGKRTVIEAEHHNRALEVHRPGPVRLIPEDPCAAIEARFMDRVFDNYVATPQAKFVFRSAPSGRKPRPLRGRGGPRETGHSLSMARGGHGGTRVGGGRCLQPRRLRGRAVYIMSVLVAAVILLIQDIDRPSAGFVSVSQQPMVDTAAALESYSAEFEDTAPRRSK